jgi:hypothetical protein
VTTYYGEFSPRLSFGKIFDRNLEFGPIKDVLLAMTYERRRRQRGLPDRPRLRPERARLQLLHPELLPRNTEGSRPGDNVWQITPAGPTPFPWAAPTS